MYIFFLYDNFTSTEESAMLNYRQQFPLQTCNMKSVIYEKFYDLCPAVSVRKGMEVFLDY